MASLRITGGNLKGKRISVPKGHQVRPPTAAVREALFSIIGASVRDSRVLDLFSGSGSIGIEALSRGASSATFVEHDSRTRKHLVRNLCESDLVNSSVVIGLDVGKAIKNLRSKGLLYDIVFIDPPFEMSTDYVKRITVDAISITSGIHENAIFLHVPTRKIDFYRASTQGLAASFKKYGSCSIIVFESGKQTMHK